MKTPLISIDGASPNLVSISVNLPAMLSLLNLSNLPLGIGSGRLGLQWAASFSSGLPSTTDVGQQTGLPNEVCLILQHSLFAIRQRSQSSISLFLASLSRQVWTIILQRLDLSALAPQTMNNHFCWFKAAQGVLNALRKRSNSLIILVAWELWKHCNNIVFNGAMPTISEVLLAVANESGLWGMAGASALRELLSRTLALGS